MVSKPAVRDIRSHTQRERLVAFRPQGVSAPFALRCGSLLADYLLVIVVPVAFLLISRASGNDGSALINSGLNDIGWLTGLLIAFVTALLLPVATGRSFGKFFTGLRVVLKDGSEPGIGRIIIRQALALILFPLTAGLSFFLSALTPTGRTLHDYLAGTIVIYAEKRPR